MWVAVAGLEAHVGCVVDLEAHVGCVTDLEAHETFLN